MSGIYFMQDGHGYIKIGISKFPKSRMDGLQGGNPTKIELLAWHEDDTPVHTEQAFHFMLEELGLRARGEWFVPSIFTTVLANTFIDSGVEDAKWFLRGLLRTNRIQAKSAA